MSAFLGIPLIEDPLFRLQFLRGLRSSDLKRVGDALKAAPPLGRRFARSCLSISISQRSIGAWIKESFQRSRKGMGYSFSSSSYPGRRIIRMIWVAQRPPRSL